MTNLTPSALTKLCTFGADVGTRLVQLSETVDGMPSAVKSLGFEIWAACEVLCELANIVARAQENKRISFFNAEALEEIEIRIETCDEVFHEAARGVLVAYDRLKALRPQPEKGSKGKPVKSIISQEKIGIGFEERVRWPLFQHRVKQMMEGLMNAKMDISLIVLVFWVNWEKENRRKSRSSIFSVIPPEQRLELIDQLWHSRLRREQHESEHRQPIPTWSSTLSSGSTIAAASKAPSIFTLSHSGSTSPDDNSASTASTTASTSSKDSLLKRMGRKFSMSGKKLGLLKKSPPSSTPRSTAPEVRSNDPFNRPQTRSPSRARSNATSITRAESIVGDTYSIREGRPGLRRNPSSRPGLNGERYSLLSLTETPQAAAARSQQLNKRSSWTAGPTRSAKEGIDREWELMTIMHESGPWINTTGELGGGSDPRELGSHLLFRQLQALVPVWAVQDMEEMAATVELLTENWIEPGQFRRRRMEWESIVDLRREPYMMSHAAASTEGFGNKFHFGR